MAQNQAIDYFGYRHPLAKLHSQSTLRMRRKMYEFLKTALGGVENCKILDHGSTPDTRRAASNCFLRWLVEDGARVYATSPEEIRHLEQAIPGVTVVAWPVQGTQSFDHLLSSAVIEHVGSEAHQVDYVRSLLAISPTLFITTPNRYHWLEFHTKLPLLHWLPRPWHRTLLRGIGLKFWAHEENLRLLSKQEFTAILHKAAAAEQLSLSLHWYTPRFLGAVSNLCVWVKATPAIR